MGIERTTIGSFPKGNKPLVAAIRDVIDLQLKYGIDVITDGEQRADMITYFEQIPGLSRGNRGLRVCGKIGPMEDSDDFFKIRDYHWVQSYLDSVNRRDVKTKITLTGPVTLGMTSAMGGLIGYGNMRDASLYLDCVNALLPLANRALEVGAHLQIDEPGISARFESPKYLERLLSALPDSAIDEGRVSLHVCGSVAHVFKELMDLSVNVFSFGFSRAQESKNIETISSESLRAGKKLGVGFISNTALEDSDTALRRLNKIAGIVGVDNVAYIHPDCGFGSTSPELVEPILRNMKGASDVFIGSLSNSR
jgi:5-methyltetrahydropteroyltriglutamate--homocysteine methyltransferase